jgi:hypothetical protein
MVAVLMRNEDGKSQSGNCLICEEFCGCDIAFVGVAGGFEAVSVFGLRQQKSLQLCATIVSWNHVHEGKVNIPPMSQMCVVRILVEAVT